MIREWEQKNPTHPALPEWQLQGVKILAASANVSQERLQESLNHLLEHFPETEAALLGAQLWIQLTPTQSTETAEMLARFPRLLAWDQSHAEGKVFQWVQIQRRQTARLKFQKELKKAASLKQWEVFSTLLSEWKKQEASVFWDREAWRWAELWVLERAWEGRVEAVQKGYQALEEGLWFSQETWKKNRTRWQEAQQSSEGEKIQRCFEGGPEKQLKALLQKRLPEPLEWPEKKFQQALEKKLALLKEQTEAVKNLGTQQIKLSCWVEAWKEWGGAIQDLLYELGKVSLPKALKPAVQKILESLEKQKKEFWAKVLYEVRTHSVWSEATRSLLRPPVVCEGSLEEEWEWTKWPADSEEVGTLLGSRAALWWEQKQRKKALWMGEKARGFSPQEVGLWNDQWGRQLIFQVDQIGEVAAPGIQALEHWKNHSKGEPRNVLLRNAARLLQRYGFLESVRKIWSGPLKGGCRR